MNKPIASREVPTGLLMNGAEMFIYESHCRRLLGRRHSAMDMDMGGGRGAGWCVWGLGKRRARRVHNISDTFLRSNVLRAGTSRGPGAGSSCTRLGALGSQAHRHVYAVRKFLT